MNVALVYDRVNKWGGAERVLLALHRMFPDAPIFTSVYNSQNASWAKRFKVRPSFIQKLPFADRHHELYPCLMPIAFESFNFDEYDLVISVTSEAAKGILTKPQTKHLCYLLTPTRYLWSGYSEYFQNPAFRFLTRPLVRYLRMWDQVAAERPDMMVAISREVQARIQKYYKRETEVLYPPVTLMDKGTRQENPAYFLVVSRLSKQTPYKRVDLAIDVVTQMNLPLHVVGDGNLLNALRARAGNTVTFLGNLSDKELIKEYQGARGLIFPGREDFGLVMVEAQQFGVPVIAYDKGGAAEIVTHGKTGVLFSSQSKKGLREALALFETMRFDRATLNKNAKQFSFEEFQKQLQRLIEQLF